MVAVWIVLIAMALAGVLTFSHRLRLGAALVLGALALIWLPVNSPVEGRTLFVLSWNHGVTEADLLTVLALAWAGLAVLLHMHRSMA